MVYRLGYLKKTLIFFFWPGNRYSKLFLSKMPLAPIMEESGRSPISLAPILSKLHCYFQGVDLTPKVE